MLAKTWGHRTLVFTVKFSENFTCFKCRCQKMSLFLDKYELIHIESIEQGLAYDKPSIMVLTINVFKALKVFKLTSLMYCVKPTSQRTGDRSFYAGWVCGTSQAQKVWSLLPPAPPAWRISGPSTKQTVQWSHNCRLCGVPNRGPGR